MASILRTVIQGEDVVVFGVYHPWGQHKERGGTSSNYPQHSSYILDLKGNKPGAIRHFYDYMISNMRDGYTICIVPSHSPQTSIGGLRNLAAKFVSSGKCGDGLDCLVRHTAIVKLAAGGERSLSVHRNSICVENSGHIAGRSILLLDDVVTTGWSLVACKQLLMEAGAAAVQCVALGRTALADSF